MVNNILWFTLLINIIPLIPFSLYVDLIERADTKWRAILAIISLPLCFFWYLGFIGWFFYESYTWFMKLPNRKYNETTKIPDQL